jgi:hypothetical protein
MKIFPEPNLFKDPIYWAKTAVGSKFKFWVSVFIQVLTAAFVLYASTRGKMLDSSWVIVVLFMIVFPFYYLYALRKLLLELQEREKTRGDEAGGVGPSPWPPD